MERRGVRRGPPKRSKRVMNLQQKVKILDLLTGGMTTAAVSREYGVNESTIRCIRGQEDKIRLLVSKFPSAKRAQFSKREVLLTKMEDLLVEWIAGETRRSGQPTTKAVCEKALELFHEVKARATEDEIGEGAVFSASRGWYNNFRKRHMVHPTLMLTTSLCKDVNATLAAADIKEEVVDLDTDGVLYPEEEDRGKYNIFTSPAAYRQGRVGNDSDYNVEQSDKDFPEEQFRHFIAPHDSEPSDNEVEMDYKCGQVAYPGLTIQRLEQLMEMAVSLKDCMSELDPDPSRSLDVRNKIDSAMVPYRELLKDMKERASQPRITDFFKPVFLNHQPPLQVVQNCESGNFGGHS